MSFPFGFGPPDRSGAGGSDPTGGAAPFFAELEKLLSWSGGPVNWDLARQVAVRTAVEGGDPTPARSEAAEVAEALRLADLWLEPHTVFPAGTTTTAAWSRQQWVEATLPVWRQLCDPVAGRVVEAMGSGLGEGLSALTGGEVGLPEGVPPELLQGLAGGGALSAMMTQMGGLMFGAQVGQALGALARDVVSGTEIGLPLGPVGQGALVPANVVAFSRGLGVDVREVRLYLALREAAHQRLFAHVPWLRRDLLAMVAAYAAGITVDGSAVGEAMSSLDPTNPESMQRALSGGMFEVETTPEQQVALRRLETMLALIEGWVDTVVHAAAQGTLPGAVALREAVRRRRAGGGPAEQTFATLVGLELRPRRLREAAQLWAALDLARGTEGRDALWEHPDLLPRADDLDDPESFGSSTDTDIDPIAEIEALERERAAAAESDQGATEESDGEEPEAPEA